jgi:hypothetical protein
VNRVSKLLLLSCLVCAAACSVPSINELEEQEGHAGCNDTDHPCPSDFVCFENRCIRTTGLACRPGTREACGSDVGMCQKGTRLCGADGTFGDCQDEVGPKFERCDGQDNDCDGETDYWSSISLTRENELGSFMAAVPVNRSSVGKPDSMLVLTTEAGRIVTRAFLADGTVHEGETISPLTQGSSFQSPALAVDGDSVAAAWIERTPNVVAPGRATFKVLLAMLDGSGKRVLQERAIPYGSALPNVSEVRLAINSTHVLVLVMAVGNYDPSTPVPTVEVWAVTIPRDLNLKSVSTPFKLATPVDGFGIHATVNGASDRFVVAYEDVYSAKVSTISNEGVLGTTASTFRTPDSHSPFVVLNASGFILYYVYYNAEKSQSELKTWSCPASPTAGCSQGTLTTISGSRIVRMQMATRTGEQKPSLALWVATDEGSSSLRNVSVATIAGSTVERSKPISTYPSYAETLVLMPDSSRYFLYQNDVTALASSAVALSSQVSVLPFCGP